MFLQQRKGHAFPAYGLVPLRLAPQFPLILKPIDVDDTGKPVDVVHADTPSRVYGRKPPGGSRLICIAFFLRAGTPPGDRLIPPRIRHTLAAAEASLIYKATGNLRAVQILLDHTNIDNTVRYLAVDIGDALTLSERIEI